MRTEQAIKEFIDSRIANNLSPLTIEWYTDKLKRFARLYPELPQEPRAIESFLASITGCPETRHAYFRALRALFKFISKRYEIPNPVAEVSPPRCSKKMMATLEPGEMMRLLHSASCLTFRVLNLTCPHSLAEIQKYAQIPPGQALLLLAPDSEAPDDLFPEDVLKPNAQSKTLPRDDELIHLWDKAKRMVWQIEMQDYQICNYFSKYHNTEAGLKDFESPLPPAKFTAEKLASFIKDIERHTQGN